MASFDSLPLDIITHMLKFLKHSDLVHAESTNQDLRACFLKLLSRTRCMDFSADHSHDEASTFWLLSQLAKHGCECLRELISNGYIDDSPSRLAPVFRSCPNIEKVELSHIAKSDILSTLASSERSLQNLRVFADDLTMSHVDQLGDCCPDLQTLRLDLFPRHHGSQTANDGVRNVLVNCEKLQSLQLRWFNRIGEVFDGHLGETCITNLALQYCGVTTPQCEQITETFPHLKTISLNGNSGVGDEGLYTLMKLPHLEEVNLVACPVSPRCIQDARDQGITLTA